MVTKPHSGATGRSKIKQQPPVGGKAMTKMKGHKKAKTEFSVKRIERKKTRHLTGSALTEAIAKIVAARAKTATVKPTAG